MRLFVFGAGASYGAGSRISTESAERPPLTASLFADQYKGSAKAVGLPIGRIDDYVNEIAKHPTLEDWLTSKWLAIERVRTETVRDKELFEFGRLTFYIWHVLQYVSKSSSSQDLYRRLVEYIARLDEDVGFVSFNYDTLLDQAIQEVYGARLDQITEYQRKKFSKPHGSVNWWMRMRPTDQPLKNHITTVPRQLIHVASGLMFKEPLHRAKDIIFFDPSSPALNDVSFVGNLELSRDSRPGFGYPLLFLPLRVKQYRHVEAFEETMLNDAKVLFRSASEIYMIGYRAEDDIAKELFTAMRGRPKLNVVGTATAGTIATKIFNMGNFEMGTVRQGGIEEFVKNIEHLVPAKSERVTASATAELGGRA